MSSLYVNQLYAFTGSVISTPSIYISGSANGNVSALSIVSNTASMDCSKANFFTLQLVGSTDTHLVPTNFSSGQTINVKVNTTGSGTVSFPSSVQEATGSEYVPTTTTGIDVLTFIAFDSSKVLLSNLKNFVG